MEKLDWRWPIETVPNEQNPIPVPCEFVEYDGLICFKISGAWVSPSGVNRKGAYWYCGEGGDCQYGSELPFIRSVQPAPNPIIEHIIGPLAVFIGGFVALVGLLVIFGG